MIKLNGVKVKAKVKVKVKVKVELAWLTIQFLKKN